MHPPIARYLILCLLTGLLLTSTSDRSAEAKHSSQNTTSNTLVFLYGVELNGEILPRCASISPDGTGYTLIDDGGNAAHDFPPPCYSTTRLLSDGTSWLGVYMITNNPSIHSDDEIHMQTRDSHGENPVTLYRDVTPLNRSPAAYWRITAFNNDQEVLFWNEDIAGEYNNFQGTGELVKINIDPIEITSLAVFEDSEPRFLTNVNRYGQAQLNLSPDGAEVLFLQDEESDKHLYTIATDGSGVHPLVENGSVGICASWEPNSSRVAIEYSAPQIASITVASANARSGPGSNYGVVNVFSYGTELEVLEVRSGWFRTLNQSGQEVWVSTSLADLPQTRDTIDLVSADGLTQTSLAIGRFPAWSPDGQFIAYNCLQQERTRGLCIITPDGSEMHELTSDGPSSIYWSPDGSKIAYITHNSSITGESSYDLVIYDLISGNEYRVLNHQSAFVLACGSNGAPIQWSPDGQWILYEVILPDPQGRTGVGGGTAYYVCNTEGCTDLNELAEIDGNSSFSFARWMPAVD